MGDKCVESIPVTKYIDFPRGWGAEREPVAPTPETTILWLRQAGVLRAAEAAPVVLLVGAEGLGGQH